MWVKAFVVCVLVDERVVLQGALPAAIAAR